MAIGIFSSPIGTAAAALICQICYQQAHYGQHTQTHAHTAAKHPMHGITGNRSERGGMFYLRAKLYIVTIFAVKNITADPTITEATT